MTTSMASQTLDAARGSAQPDRTSRRPVGWELQAPEAIEDAEFETVCDPVRQTSRFADGMRPSRERSTPGSLGILTKKRPPRSAPRRASAGLRFPLLLCAAIALSAYAGHLLSGTAGSAMPGAFHVEDVTTRMDPGAKDGLFVSGVVRNLGQKTATTPPLVVALERNGQIVARYYLGTSGHLLAPHGFFNFSGRFPATIEGAETVRVFFNRDRSGR